MSPLDQRLIDAVKCDNVDQVKSLIQFGVRLCDGKSALYYAAKLNHVGSIHVMMSIASRLHRSEALRVSVKYKREAACMTLLLHGADDQSTSNKFLLRCRSKLTATTDAITNLPQLINTELVVSMPVTMIIIGYVGPRVLTSIVSEACHYNLNRVRPRSRFHLSRYLK